MQRVKDLIKNPRFQIAAVILAIFLLGTLTGYLSGEKETVLEKESGGPVQKTESDENKSGFLYEKREILAYRPNGFNRVQVTGILKNFGSVDSQNNESKETVLYSYIDDPFKRVPQKRTFIPTAYITKDSNVFLSGVGEQNFVILDRFGDNVTEELPFLKDHSPWGNFLRNNNSNVFFTKQGQTLYQWKNKKAEPVVSFSFNENFFPKIEGFDGNPEIIYVSKKGGLSYAELFRVNTADKTFLSYQGLKGSRNDQMTVCAENEKAVFIRHTLDPTKPPYGEPKGPSGLVLLDLQSDTASEIISSNYLFEDMRVSCGSERILVKENGKWLFLGFDGKSLKHKLQNDESVAVIGEDGKKAVIRKLSKTSPAIFTTFLKNIKSGDIEWKADDFTDAPSENSGKEPQIRYTVTGLIKNIESQTW